MPLAATGGVRLPRWLVNGRPLPANPWRRDAFWPPDGEGLARSPCWIRPGRPLVLRYGSVRGAREPPLSQSGGFFDRRWGTPRLRRRLGRLCRPRASSPPPRPNFWVNLPPACRCRPDKPGCCGFVQEAHHPHFLNSSERRSVNCLLAVPVFLTAIGPVCRQASGHPDGNPRPALTALDATYLGAADVTGHRRSWDRRKPR